MSMQSHLQELVKKHAALEIKIASEHRRPSSNALDLQALKKRKLHIKDEIERARRLTAA